MPQFFTTAARLEKIGKLDIMGYYRCAYKWMSVSGGLNTYLLFIDSWCKYKYSMAFCVANIYRLFYTEKRLQNWNINSEDCTEKYREKNIPDNLAENCFLLNSM